MCIGGIAEWDSEGRAERMPLVCQDEGPGQVVAVDCENARAAEDIIRVNRDRLGVFEESPGE